MKVLNILPYFWNPIHIDAQDSGLCFLGGAMSVNDLLHGDVPRALILDQPGKKVGGFTF
jgi:hypothetical protein